MGAPQYEQAGADIGGTGTTNTIPRWTGPSTLGDSGLIDNGTAIYTTTRRLLIGVSGTPVSSEIKTVVGGTGNGGQEWIGATGGGIACVPINGGGGQYYTFTGLIGAESYTASFKATSTGLDISTAAYGLKLPATPGNADTQTLDCYQEGTWTPTLTGFGGTTPTIQSARFTRIGRVVSLQVVIQATGGASFSSTASSTYISLPSGMSAFAPAPGATSNSGIAADGSCVAYNNGNLYLPTFALRTADTFLNVTYSV